MRRSADAVKRTDGILERLLRGHGQGHLQLAKVNGRLEKVNLPRFANEAALSLYRKDFKRRCRERAQSSQSGAVLTKGFFRQWVSGNPAELLACYIIGRFAAAPQPGSFQVCGGNLRPEDAWPVSGEIGGSSNSTTMIIESGCRNKYFYSFCVVTAGLLE